MVTFLAGVKLSSRQPGGRGPAPCSRDTEHSLCSAASRHSPAAPISPTYPHSRAVGVTVPARTSRTPDALKSNLGLLSAGPMQKRMLWFLTPLLGRLPCCGRKPARWWRLEPRREPGAKRVPWALCSTGSLLRALGTAGPLRILHHTCTPGTHAADTLQCWTLCHAHDALWAPCTTHPPCSIGTLHHGHPVPWAPCTHPALQALCMGNSTLNHGDLAQSTLHPGHRQCPDPKGKHPSGISSRCPGWVTGGGTQLPHPGPPSSAPLGSMPPMPDINDSFCHIPLFPSLQPRSCPTPRLPPCELQAALWDLLPVPGVQQGSGSVVAPPKQRGRSCPELVLHCAPSLAAAPAALARLQ